MEGGKNLSLHIAAKRGHTNRAAATHDVAAVHLLGALAALCENREAHVVLLLAQRCRSAGEGRGRNGQRETHERACKGDRYNPWSSLPRHLQVLMRHLGLACTQQAQ